MTDTGVPGATTAPGSQPDDLHWDPFDESIKADPHRVWRRLRDEAPLYRNDQYDFWALSRFDDVDAAHRDPRTFSSAHGTVLEIMGNEDMAGSMMIFMDPPEHTRLRRLVSRAFTPRRVATLEADIRALCRSLLDAQRGRNGFDYVADFGAILPATVIATLLGVPPDERETVRAMIDQTFHLEPGVGMINDVSLAGMMQLHEVITQLLDERRLQPRDDMMTDLITAEVEDDDGTTRKLTSEESTSFAILLVSAGTETVARLLGWAGYLLAGNPDQRRTLVDDPGLIPNAVEELLRYEAPSPVQGRWVTTDVELHGTTVPANSKMLLLTGSAGRDERRYPDADRFDVRRKADQHVSFGYGIHFCLGAALARMEGRIALEETLARYPTWEVDHDRAVFLHTSTVRGYAELPIVV
jgi:cytochrome P450